MQAADSHLEAKRHPYRFVKTSSHQDSGLKSIRAVVHWQSFQTLAKCGQHQLYADNVIGDAGAGVVVAVAVAAAAGDEVGCRLAYEHCASEPGC